MKIDKISKITISLNRDEVLLLENALTLIQKIHREINNCDVEEYDFDDDRNAKLLANISDELDEFCVF